MTYQEALSHIHSFGRFSAKPTLDRMETLMGLLGDPQERLRIVHVAGTNGKGSTCAMIASMLEAAGYRTGLYTSPFVLDFRERIQIDREMISRSELTESVERVSSLAARVDDLNEFEFVTAVAYDYFARKNCDVVVAEVGLGGAFDATNVVRRPLISVITQIGLDHTAVLGGTVAEIARTKAGIIKAGVPVVTCAAQDVDALAVIYEEACARGAPVIQPSPHPEWMKLGLEGTELGYRRCGLHIPLAGRHQVDNAMTAFTVAVELGRTPEFGKLLLGDAIPRGIASARIPARFEIVGRDPLVILDGAHNPQAARALADALSLAGDRPVTGVMGVLADKDGGGALSALAPRFRRLICVTPKSPRALDAHLLAERADALGLRASAAHSAGEAVELARAVAASEGGVVAVCGSLYLASEVRALFFPGVKLE